MKKWIVKIIQILVFYFQLYLMVKFGPELINFVEVLQNYINQLSTSIEMKFIITPIAIFICLLIVGLLMSYVAVPQWLLEKLEGKECSDN